VVIALKKVFLKVFSIFLYNDNDSKVLDLLCNHTQNKKKEVSGSKKCEKKIRKYLEKIFKNCQKSQKFLDLNIFRC